jgi:hypothetical protein
MCFRDVFNVVFRVAFNIQSKICRNRTPLHLSRLPHIASAFFPASPTPGKLMLGRSNVSRGGTRDANKGGERAAESH